MWDTHKWMVVFVQEKPTATANKVRTNSRGRAGDAGDGVLMSKLSGEFSKDNGKGGTKLSPNLEDFPAPKRTSRQVFYIISINYGTLCQRFFHAKFEQLSVDRVVNAISSIVVLSFVWLFLTHNLFPCQIAVTSEQRWWLTPNGSQLKFSCEPPVFLRLGGYHGLVPLLLEDPVVGQGLMHTMASIHWCPVSSCLFFLHLFTSVLDEISD